MNTSELNNQLTPLTFSSFAARLERCSVKSFIKIILGDIKIDIFIGNTKCNQMTAFTKRRFERTSTINTVIASRKAEG